MEGNENASSDDFSDDSYMGVEEAADTAKDIIGYKTPLVRHASSSSMEIRVGNTIITEGDWLRSRGKIGPPVILPYPLELVGRLPRMADAFARVMQEQFVYRIRVAEGDGTHAKCRFRRKTVPAISLFDYIARICNYIVALEPVMLLGVLVYARVLDPPSEGGGRTILAIDAYSVHRFVITAVCVANKAMGDYYYSNSFYAKVGGISTGELNRLEIELVQHLDWKLQCDTAEIARCWEIVADAFPIV